MVLELIPLFVFYALLGAGVREVWGIWKVYTALLSVKIRWVRILVDFLAAGFFGIVGAFVLSAFGLFPIGINLTAFGSAILSGNVIDLVAKKLGFSRKIEVVVSDQQLALGDLNPRQANAIEYVKQHGKITNSIYQKLNQTTRNVVRRDLEQLVAKGELKKHGSGRGAYYSKK